MVGVVYVIRYIDIYMYIYLYTLFSVNYKCLEPVMVFVVVWATAFIPLECSSLNWSMIDYVSI